MRTSIIIPAHGRPDLVIRCLESLGRDRQGDLEYDVCVVNDCGDLDGDALRESANPDYPLVWRSFQVPRGRSAARNEGVRATDGDLILFLDSDMEAAPGMIAAHIDSHRDRPRTVAVGNITWPDDGSFHRYIGSRGVTKLAPGDPVPPWYFPTGNSSLERRDLPTGDPFDESLPGWGGEDLDLGMRLAAAGVSFTYCPDAASFHHFDGDLPAHIARLEAYGRTSVPELIRRYPALVKVLRLNLMAETGWRIAVSSTVAGPAAWAARRLDSFPLPDSLFDYITFAAYARGWLDGRRE